jgi:hypothetical protein
LSAKFVPSEDEGRREMKPRNPNKEKAMKLGGDALTGIVRMTDFDHHNELMN